MQTIKIIVEKHADGYVAYPLGLKGIVVGEGDTYEGALADVESAIRFHIETFGPDIFEINSPELDAFVAETGKVISLHISQSMHRRLRSLENSNCLRFLWCE